MKIKFFSIFGVLFLYASFCLAAGELQGLNAIITGGSRGIGEACAHALAKEGANIAIVVNKSIDEAQEVAAAIQKYGVEAAVFACDVANPAEVEKMVNAVMARWGSIDILVNNAGIAQCVPAEEMSYQDWQRMIDVNLTGVFLCSQTAGKIMIERGQGGAIVNISSICGHIVVLPQKQCHYNAAKGGVGMLTKSLAVEWANYGIRVNAISPGYINTKLVQFAKDLHPTWMEKTPMHTLGEPEDIAQAVLYLVSPKAKFITGCDWIIDGGYVCP